ncbi:MAG TPA: diguanylate cyclase, partial [Vicinamibacterales bacterium]|nr:diguanylate cyclase [Vicinamibacterales bacterium]
LIVLDLDRLKEINDTYGHEAGDRALRVVGNVLGSTVRENDLCGRFAGDERMYRDKAGRRSRSSARHSLARNERA